MSPSKTPQNEPTTQQKLLREAQLLLQTRGFDSFSFQDLADKVGIRKASVHAHFKDKEELGVRLVDQYIADWNQWVAYVAAREPVEQIMSFGRMVKKVYIVGEQLCANGAFFSDWGMLPARMQKQALAFQALQIDWITRTIERAREAGDLKFEGPARKRAEQWFVMIVGALQAARAWNHPDFLESMIRMCLADLGWKEKSK